MKIITQCAYLFFICLAGIFLSELFPFPVPASVLSMLLLLALLCVKAIKPSALEDTTDFLLNNMAFFFIPSGVGILAYIDVLRGNVLILFLICVVTTLLTFAVTAFTVSAAVRMQRRFGRGGRP